MPPEVQLENHVSYEDKSSKSSSDAIEGNIMLNSDRIQVDNKVYSTEKLASFHPGGDLFVKAFSGLDATEAFLSYHRRKFPHARMSNYLIGNVSSRKNDLADQDYLELCSIIDQILPQNKSFAPWHYFLKIFVLLVAAIGLEVYIHSSQQYVWYLTAGLGLLKALIGMNIQHDANHGAISRNHFINRLLGYSQNWIGGSAIDWIHQHVVQHHVNTNDIHHDPDIVGSAILRLNPLKPLEKIHGFQHLYTFVLILLFGFTIGINAFLNILNGFHHIPMSKFLNKYRLIDALMSIIYFARWAILPLYLKPSIWTVISIAPMYIVGGFYLAFFFIISHNFRGVSMFDKSSGFDKNESFLFSQVTSSSNVGGPILCFINGGLNYQIEHHLFPRIQHSHYPKIAPIVRAFCEKKGITYTHFPTIGSNVWACIEHLNDMGHTKMPTFVTQSTTTSLHLK